MTEDEFLTLTLPERVAWLHSAQGPRGKMSHDRFAAALGTSRQVVIKWENGGEPSPKFRARLAEFSGFPEEAFSRREAEAIVAASTARRMAELEARIAELTALSREAFQRLDEEIQRLREAPPVRRRAKSS